MNVKTETRFSLRYKLIVIFGTLVFFAIATENILAITKSKKSILEEVKTHLIDKAKDTASIINKRIFSLFQFIERIARLPFLKDKNISILEKVNL